MPNPSGLLRGGMLVAVRVRTQYHPDAIVVPRSAIVVNPSGATVFVVVEMPPPAGGAPAGAAGPPGPAAAGRPPVHIAQAKLVPVRVGLQTDVDAEVLSPEIHAGTTVISTRPDALQDKGMVAITSVPPGGGAARSQGAASGAQ
jgi:multidrug efflux pump subunit AcrA (membrane-fusion protein)